MKPNPFIGKDRWAFDTETYLIQPGLLAPPLVCGSWARDPADAQPDYPAEGILTPWQTRKDFRSILEGGMVLIGHNLAYDLGVMCADDPTLVPLVFAKLDRDEAFDTLLAEQLIEIHQGTLGMSGTSSSGSGHSLADLVQKYLGRDRSAEKHGPDAWRLRYAELDGIPLSEWPEAAKAYPIQDARDTYDVAAIQIQDGRNLHDLPAQIRAHWALHLSAIWGVRTDREWVDQFSTKVTAEHTRSRARFLAAGLLKVRRCVKKDGVLETPDHIDQDALATALGNAQRADLGSPTAALLRKALADLEDGKPQRYGTDKKALEAAVTAAYHDDPPKSAKGNIRTNKDTLWESGDKLLEEFADAQDNEKFFSTYLKVLKQGTEVPINPRVNVLVASGRCSLSKPNLQNLPRGGPAGNPREGFVSRPDTAWSSNDYPTLELRTLAFALEHLGCGSSMADALRGGLDLHAKLAAQIMGVSVEEFGKRLKAKDAKAKDFRQMAKAANFGLPGGLGPVKLVAYARQSYDARFCLLSGRADACGLEKFFDKRSRTTVCKACLEVAKELRDTWFQTFPEMKPYFELVTEWTSREVVEVFDEDGFPEEMRVGAVEQLISGRIRGRCNFPNGANTIFQGLAADVAKRALWLVSQEAYCDPTSTLWGSRPVIFVHDEIVTEHPEGRAHEAAFRVAELMNRAFHEFCPAIPCDVRPALMRRWYKGAEETYQGERLVPWEPKAAGLCA